jgi:signal transduction histidine kinase
LVLNLLLNGIEAMNPVVNRPKRLLVCSKRQGSDNILVEISDSGEGLKDAERIFDSFYTTKPNGMGMGLAICRSITESHNGRLWAESRDDSGATFCFTLPVCSRVDP